MSLLHNEITCDYKSTRQREIDILDELLSSSLNKGARQQTITALFARFSSLRRIVHAPKRSMREITHNGVVAFNEIQKARKLAIALAGVEIKNHTVLMQHDAIIDYCRTILAGERRELFYVLL